MHSKPTTSRLTCWPFGRPFSFLFHLFTWLFSVGNLTGQSTIEGIVNTYTPVVDFACAGNALLVENAAGFGAGDEVLLIQMKGAIIDTSNSPAFGDIHDLRGAGNYEFNRVKSVQGNRVSLQFQITRSYQFNGRVQLIRVPEYQDVSAKNLRCQPWDGRTGGVLAIDAKGTLTFTGDADVSNAGFRGGKYSNYFPLTTHETGYFYGHNAQKSAEKGEGIYDLGAGKVFGRGKVGNGGGGGNAHNAGGGGGGSFGKGGRGGKEFSHTTPIEETFGVGGLDLDGFSDRLFLGGGGGSGNSNDDTGTSGGRGGGIAIFLAKNIVGNGASIRANGETVNASPDNHDGQSGGGAGGTVAIWSENIVGGLRMEAKGGKGGNSIFLGVPSQLIGPGGGGGGGGLARYHATPSIPKVVSGGANGIANLNSAYGAVPGEVGGELQNIALPLDTFPVEYDLHLSVQNPDCDHATGSISVATSALAYILNGNAPQSPGFFGSLPPGTYLLQFDFFGGCIFDTTIVLPEISFSTKLLTIHRCLGQSIEINGTIYTASATVFDTLPAFGGGCDTIALIELIFSPLPSKTATVSLCPGSPFVLDGQSFFAPAIVLDTLFSATGICDTVLILSLIETPLVPKNQTLGLCPGAGFWANGAWHFPPEILLDTLPGTAGGCDTLRALRLFALPLVPKKKALGLCPGESYLFDGQAVVAPAVLFDTLPAAEGCDTLLSIELAEIEPPRLSREVLLCLGETIAIGHKNYGQPGTVLDTLPAAGGCGTLRTTVIEVAESAWPFLSPDTSLCAGESVVLVSALASTVWSGQIAAPALTVTESGTYVAIGTDANGCPARDSVLVSTCCFDAGIFLPNIFSPNGDGLNDVFRAFFTEQCAQFTLSVHDRWGELLWKSTGPESGWDGRFRGKLAAPGVYVWMLEIRERGSRKTEIKKGNVTLVR